MTQEPPKREHWRKQRETEVAATEKKQAQPKPIVTAARSPRPTELVTSSIPKPRKPPARPETLRTTEKVRLRKEASTSSEVVATLKGGLSVTSITADGKWRKVSVDGMVGWVHSDYLKFAGKSASQVATVTTVPVRGEVPRPKENITPKRETTAIPVSAPSDKTLWGAMRPARVPQEGDCQCPYDVMLNGKQCGDRSAYAKGKGGECYF